MTIKAMSLRVPSELSLVLVTFVTAMGFGRMFTNWSYFPPTLAALLASHLLAIACRRRRLGILMTTAISFVLGCLTISLLLYQSTTRLGLPTGRTLHVLRIDLVEAAQLFRDVKPPATPIAGFVAATAIVFWAVAFLADWSAFRLSARFEALLPTVALFVFSSLFSAEEGRYRAAFLYVAGGLTFLLFHRSAQQEAGMAWTRGDAHRGSRALLRAGGGLMVTTLVASAFVGPLLPGARQDGLVDWKGLGGNNGTRITVSPLVDIRSRLVEQSNGVAFTVRSPVRSYWRLTALDAFDGRIWKSSQRFGKVKTSLSSQNETKAPTKVVAQEFTVDKLSQIWLPAAFEPTAIEASKAEVRWEPTTSTLIVDEPTSDGLTYKVNSAIPRFDAAALDAATDSVPAAIQKQFLALPSDISRKVVAEAQRITSAQPTPYRKALALENYFRDNFTYSLRVQAGHANDRMDEFLFQTRQGYCEQFAGSFAAMARSIGLPARVAVGFTTGDPGTEPNTFVVRGKHAHAWPEVFLAGYGWVLFEPTPGRGAPDASYTGVAEAQAGLVPTTTPNDSATSTTLTPIPDEFGVGSDPGLGLGGEGNSTGVTEPVEAPAPTRLPLFGPAGITIAAAIAVFALYAAAMFGSRYLRRSRRHSRADTPATKVTAHWADTVENLGLLGVHASTAETPTEFAHRAGSRARLEGAGFEDLAELTTAARYGDASLDAEHVSRASSTATAVADRVRSQTSTMQRINYELSPRKHTRRWLHRRP